MQTNHTTTPIIRTRIPEDRGVYGLVFGAHVSRPGRSGYYVRLDDPRHSDGPWVIALETPAMDELPGDGRDADIVQAVRDEIAELGL